MGHAVQPLQCHGRSLSEREYLRDTSQVCERERRDAILHNGQRTGRAADTTAECHPDVHRHRGLTSLSERLAPAKVARILNAYLATVGAGDPASRPASSTTSSATACLPASTCHCRSRPCAAAIQAALDISRPWRPHPFPRRQHAHPHRHKTGIVIAVTIGTETA